MQEENNLKLVLNEQRYLAREYGVARYERIRDYDFGPARRYYARTEPFWAEVRAAWRELEQGADASACARRSTRGSSSCRSSTTPQKLADGAARSTRDGRARLRRGPHAAGTT